MSIKKFPKIWIYSINDIHKRMCCNQNSIEWHTYRQLSIGSSELACLVGWNPYQSDKMKWLIDTGEEKQPELTEQQKLMLEHGHIYEKQAIRIYCKLMKINFQLHTWYAGLILHYQYPFIHTSPDCIVKCSHTQYLYALEVKCPIQRTAYYIKSTTENQNLLVERIDWPLPPVHYVIQILHQCHCLDIPFIDLIIHYVESKHLKNNTIEQNQIMNNDDIISETCAIRIYANQKASDCIIRHIFKYKAKLTKPVFNQDMIYQIHMPDITFTPIFQRRIYTPKSGKLTTIEQLPLYDHIVQLPMKSLAEYSLKDLRIINDFEPWQSIWETKSNLIHNPFFKYMYKTKQTNSIIQSIVWALEHSNEKFPGNSLNSGYTGNDIDVIG